MFKKMVQLSITAIAVIAVSFCLLITVAYQAGKWQGRVAQREHAAQQQVKVSTESLKRQQSDRAALSGAQSVNNAERQAYEQAINSNPDLGHWRDKTLPQCARVLSAGPGVPDGHLCRMSAGSDTDSDAGNKR